jgi:hypothetical protein
MPAPRTARNYDDLTVVAVDWSGARSPSAQRRCIATAIVRDGRCTVTSGRTRDETIEFVLSLAAPAVVGLDFSFGFPSWVSTCHELTDGVDVWPMVAAHGEEWLATKLPPFHGYAKGDRPHGVELLRIAERRLRAKSTFQSNGAGTVGTGSIRGMPYLARLRATGFAVWPFDAAAERTAIEIYPSALRRLRNGVAARRYATEHERDAAESALVMWDHRAELATLAATTDPVTRLEGDVWLPRHARSVRESEVYDLAFRAQNQLGPGFSCRSWP